MGQIHESACIVAHLPESLRCSAKLCRGALDDRRWLEGERGRQQQLAAGLPSRGCLQTAAAAGAAVDVTEAAAASSSSLS